MLLLCSFARSVPCEVDDSHDNGCDDNPKELEPVEERDAQENWLQVVVKRWPEHGNKRDNQQYKQPGAPLFPRFGNHSFFSFRTSYEVMVTSTKNENTQLMNMHATRLRSKKRRVGILNCSAFK
jgi:hypothetical protein